MAMTVISQALSQGTIRDVISLEKGELVVKDRNAAMMLMFNSDANSQVYKIVQLALQVQTLREQAMAKESQDNLQKLISDGKVKVLELETALKESQEKVKKLETELQDSNTQEVLRQYELTLNGEARMRGMGDIAVGLLLTPLIITTLLGLATIGGGIIRLCEKPVKLRLMEDKIALYREFYPEASLTDAFKYVQEHPAKFSKLDAAEFISIEAYKKKNPGAKFEDFEKFIEEKIHFKALLEARLKPKRTKAAHF